MQQVQKSSEAPQSVEAEAKLIGSILVDPSIMERVSKTLHWQHFHDARHAILYRCMMNLAEGGTHISPVTVLDWLGTMNAKDAAGGSAYLMELMQGIATTNPLQLDHYCRIVGDHFLRRKLIGFGKELIETSSTTSNPHELIKLSSETLVRMNGSVGGGDQRILQSTITGADLLAREIPKPESIIGEGVMTENSFVLLYGKPGMGKTWIMLQMALAVASGTAWLGLPTRQKRVGIIELEMHSYYLQQRLRDLTQHMPPEAAQEALANIEFLVRPNFTGLIDLMEQSTRDGIINWANDRGLGVLAMDALSRCHFASENDAQEMGRVLGSIERIRDETGAGIMGVHHEPKDVKDKDVSDLDAARGSSRFQSDPHTMMRLKVWRGKVALSFAKMNLGPLMEPIYVERNKHGHYQVVEAPEDAAQIRDRNLMKTEDMLLRAGSAGATTKLAASEMRLAPRTVKKYLDEVGYKVGNIYYHKSLADGQLSLGPTRKATTSVNEPVENEDVAFVVTPSDEPDETGTPDEPGPPFEDD